MDCVFSRLIAVGSAVLFISTFIASDILAQPPEVAPPSEGSGASTELTSETVQVRLQSVDALAELSDEAREKLRGLYRQAATALEAATTHEKKAAEYQHEIETADTRLTSIKEELQQTLAPQGPAKEASLSEWEAELVQLETSWKETQAKLAALTAEPARRQTRRLELPELVSTAKEKLATIQSQIKTPPPESESTAATLARHTLLAAQSQSFAAEIDSLEKELAAYTATTTLLPLQRDRATRKNERLEKEVRLYREAIEARRLKLSRDELAEARRKAAEAQPLLANLAKENQQLAETNHEMAGRLAKVNAHLLELRSQLDDIAAERLRTTEKIEAVGLNDAFGVLLRSRRLELAKLRRKLKEKSVHQGEVRDIRFQWLELEDKRSKLTNPETKAQDHLQSLEPEIKALAAQVKIDRDTLKASALSLFQEKQSLLDSSLKTHESLFETLVATSNVEKELETELEEFIAFLDERILWLRSQLPLGVADLAPTVAATWWLMETPNWVTVLRTFGFDAVKYPLYYITFLVWCFSWIFLQNRWRKLIRKQSEIANRRDCRRFRHTIYVLLASAALAIFLPLIVGFAGWRLIVAKEATEFARAVGWGFVAAAAFALPLFFLKQFCRNEGLATSHFDWTESVRRLLQLTSYWLLILATPLVFIVGALLHQSQDSFQSSLGRLATLAFLAAIAAALHFVFRAKSPIYARSRLENPASWFYRSRFAIWGFMLAIPIIFAGMMIAGYVYTAGVLMGRVIQSAWFGLAVFTLSELGLRWMVVRHRKLAMLQAEKRREAMRDQNNSQAPIEQVAAQTGFTQEDPAIDFSALSKQMQKLLVASLALISAVGLWAIWSDVLPALRILDQYQVWQVVEGEVVHHVTLQNIFMACVVGSFAFACVWNLPGLLEFVLLQRLPLDAGARFAIVTLVRYAIVILGIIFTLAQLRFQWSEYSWLVAAATVGLSFGLQEIFANFVSGLIVLMERPIRVGDVVTIDGVTGVVTRIQMRATTITNWDQQEFIVPNKEIVTGRLLNWTLSSSRNRIVVEVGVAYGSNIDKVRDFILSVANSNACVLQDPAPVVTFEKFGDSSLNFVLRCHVADLSVRLQTIHELHFGINEAFAKANISIPFPQRDLHIQTNERESTNGEPITAQNASE